LFRHCGEEKFPSMAHIHVYERAVLSTATIKDTYSKP